ncbi:hypothetical protein V8F33_008533 [Rhypophila sp. PSN 637]
MKRTIAQSGLDKSDSSNPPPATHLKASQPPPHRQRQPQTSCDFCRLKKLKCDRAKPCSTCVARSRACNGPPTPETARSSSDGQNTPDSEGNPRRAPISGFINVPGFRITHAQWDVLKRLRNLEEAVFGPPDSRRAPSVASQPTAKGDGVQAASPNTSITLQENEQPDCATACDSVSAESGYHNVRFRFAESSRLPGTSSGSLTDDLPSHTMLGTSVKSIWLPSKEGILALLDDYLQGQHMFLGIIDPRAMRNIISHVYSDLPHQKSLELSQVALLLSIAATSAFFWDKEDGHLKYQFSSAFDAANWSVFWRNSAWDLLDQLRRDIAGSLEELQATCILAHLISQIEGCPSRYRRLQGNAITIAREISLHMVDAPNAFLPWDRHGEPLAGEDLTLYQTRDSEAVKEIKRRVWWYLAGTDWLLSVMGGPLYKSYTVNPLHMNVRYPRNINDDDLQSLAPWPKDAPRERPDTTVEPPTTFTYSLLRLRVAEICYKIVDAMQPICSRHGSSSDGIEQLPYDEILRIDQLFDQVLASFPASYGLGAPIPPGAPADLDLQRQVLLLYFHARRARIFRPFLQLGTRVRVNQTRGKSQNGTRSWDLKYERFSRVCRDSARIVLAITSSLVSRGGVGKAAETMDPVVQQHSQRPKIVHRSGLILMHLFMACVILATDPTLSPNNPDQTSDVLARRRELAQGCSLLKMAGERSSMASGLMKTLTIMLNRHKLRVFCNQDRSDLDRQQSPQQSSPAAAMPLEMQQQHDNAGSQQRFPGSFVASEGSDGDDREAVSDIWDIDRLQERIKAQHAQQQKHKATAAAPVQSQSLALAENHNTGYQYRADTSYPPQFPSPAQSDILPLDGLWKDLVDAASGSVVGDASFQNSNLDGKLFGGNVDDGNSEWDHLFADLEYFVGPS